MSSTKNVGRKRLGLIAVSCASTKNQAAVKRPCQLLQTANGPKQKVSQPSENYAVDLSFSSSFTNDNDEDLLSALDKVETEYNKHSRDQVQTKRPQKSVENKGLPSANIKSSDVLTFKEKDQSKHNSFKKLGNMVTPARIDHREVVISKSSKQTPVSDSFHDLSFASPMDISTPPIFKSKKGNSGRKRSTPGQANKNPKENQKPTSKVRTSTPQVTPKRRTQRNGTAQKSHSQLKKKMVLEGLEDMEVEKDALPSRNDFFKSLMIDSISLDESGIAKGRNSESISDNQNRHAAEKNQFPVSPNNEPETSDVRSNPQASSGRTQQDERPSEEHHTQVTVDRDGDNEICPDDLPQIPTRASVLEERSMSVSITADGKTLALHPDLEADQLALSSWGLPGPVLKQYQSRGITHMFQWQAECLLMGSVLGGGNLVYSAPTSAGKTMVAELLVLKRVLETRKKAIIILPFVSVTREKMFYLQELYQDAGIRVSGFMGHYAPAGGFSSVDVAVCTIEKGNGLINRMLEDNKLDQLGIIVVDELHLIGDRSRGYLLELLLTKISYMTHKAKLTPSGEPSTNIQVVGMSATLPNLDLLARWLNADLYRTDYRPVPLSECVKIGTAIYDSSLQLVRDVDVKYAVKGDEDHVIPLCVETIRDGHSILIFCPTKNWCEKLSETVARALYDLLKNPEVAVAGQGLVNASDLLVLPLDQTALRDIVEQLRRTPVGLDSMLGRTVPFGVAYHHAGLTFDERDIVEGAFRQGILKVLIATSTLSSGVNLPARRVLIRTPVFHGQLIDFLTYKQMIGRAGRKGVDTAGESILLCKPNERSKAEQLVKGALPAVQSTLIRDEGEPLSSSMKRAILEVVVSGVAMSPADVASYASCTLLAASLTKDQDQTSDLVQQCIKFLQENEFVTLQTITGPDGTKSDRFVPTQLGAAVLSSSISPDEGLVVFSELQRARQCFVLENELHIIYQVTPIYAQIDSIDWYQYFSIWESLTPGMRRVSELVGVQESFLAKAVRGRILTNTSAQLRLLAVHKRFYTALVLHDLVQETPLPVVAQKYNCNKGQLQSLQQSAATFAGMVTVFCARLGWSNLELILSQFQNRLTFGVQRELCDLVRISALNGQRARVMYNGGYQTVAALASAHPADVEALLKNSAPFQSNKKQESESDWELEQRRKTRCIFLTGRKGVTEYEAALAIIEEAKGLIQEELGGLGIQWKPAGTEPSPKLKSPVLFSPLALNGKSKKKTKSRISSDSKLENSTSPQNKEGDSGKPVVPCVVSPSSIRQQSKVHDSGEKSDQSTRSSEICDAPVLNLRTEVKQPEANATHIEKNIYEVKDFFNVKDLDCEKNIEDKAFDASKSVPNKQEKEQNIKGNCIETITTLPSKSSTDVDKLLGLPKENIIVTTAIIETIPRHIMNSDISLNPGKLKVNEMENKIETPGNGIASKNQMVTSYEEKSNSDASSIHKNVNIASKPVVERDAYKIQTKPTLQDKVLSKDIAQDTVKEVIVSGVNKDRRVDLDKESQLKSLSSHMDNKNNTSSNIVHVKPSQLELTIGSEFGESFVIDTQSMKSLENKDSVKEAETLPAALEANNHKNEVDKMMCNTVSEEINVLSESLFSQEMHDISKVSNEMNFLGHDEKILMIEAKCKDINNANFKPNINKSTSSLNVSDAQPDVSQNALDMNISQGSNVDMFNESADLIAASCYERVGLSENSRVEHLSGNESFEDLHVPYQSGLETCFDRNNPPSNPTAANIATNLCGDYGEKTKEPKQSIQTPAFGQQLNILGKFSSQRNAKPTGNAEHNLHEDLAMAIELGESFTSTFNIPTQADLKVVGNDVKSKPNEYNVDDYDQLGDSLTYSIVEQVLEESSDAKEGTNVAQEPGNKVSKREIHGISTKLICDKNSACDNPMKSPDKGIIHKSLLISDNVIVNDNAEHVDNFKTPTREAVKRQRGTPDLRNSKMQKTTDNKYSTPEALEKHCKRSNGKSIVHNAESKSKNKTYTNNTRKRKSSDKSTPETGKASRKSLSEMNTSTGSDCVPPTPPDETPASPQIGAAGTNSRTPLRLPAASFSPRLKRTLQKCNSNELKATAGVKTQGISKQNVTRQSLNLSCNARPKPCNGNQENKLTAGLKDVGSGFNPSCKSNIRDNTSACPAAKTGFDDDKHADEGNIEQLDEESEGKEVEDEDDFQSPSFIDPSESGVPLTQQSFTIIDVCGDKRLFKTFIMEWRTKTRYAVSLACEKLVAEVPGGGIGANFKQGGSPTKTVGKDVGGVSVESLGLNIVGVAVSWDNRDAYYVSFTHDQPHGDPDDSLAPPTSDTDITIAIRVKAVKSVLQQAVVKEQPVTMVMFDVKTQYRALAEGCGFAPKGQFEDPKIACWMLDPGANEKNLHRMVTNLLPTEVHMLHGIGGGIGVSSLGMSPQNPGSGRYRATTEAVLVRHLSEYFRRCLQKEGIYGTFQEVEMPSAVALCRMELNGFGFSQDESERQKTVMISKLSALEEQAYTLAGHPFSLSATEDVGQVLFIELQLPMNSDPNSGPAPKHLAPKRGGPRRGKTKTPFSTSKDILEKLKKLHPLPGVILEWRRITNALTKTVFPLQKEKVSCDWLSMYRIYGDCQLHTATGRVSMTEPNLQNVPKDFEILLPDLIGESPPPDAGGPVGRRTRAGSSRLQQMIGSRQVAKVTDDNTGSQFCVSMRHAFVPFSGGVLLAADYSQLELRMIAYLANDTKLINILNKDGDVFKLITAQWKNIKPEDVTPEQRAQAKQVCYGMIYGIGAKALSEQLDVEENDAAVFIETFKAKYPGMRAYLRHTVEDCRTKGYVQTMSGRKRYLQSITASNPHARAQAERQAVNTTVQGSAADLVKMAMIRIDQRLAEIFPNTQYTHKHKLTSKHPSRNQLPPEGAFFVLQLHDELIYEVTESHVHTVAQLVKHCMETAKSLPVKMPVKVKVGPSWGKLKDYEL